MQTLDTLVLTRTEHSQMERKDLARGAYSQGQSDNALLIIDSVLAEPMTERVAAECWVAKAAFQVEERDFIGCLESLGEAAKFIDAADARVQGAFYYQRARAYKELGNIDAAITDYSGAAAFLDLAGLKDREALTLNSLALVFLKIGDVDRAREQIDKAVAICPNGSEYSCHVYDTVAEISLREGKLESALAASEQSILLAGENDLWRSQFLETKAKIRRKLLTVLGVNTATDLDTLQTEMLYAALKQAGGARERAGEMIGLSRKGVEYLIDNRKELAEFKRVKRVRRKSIIVKV